MGHELVFWRENSKQSLKSKQVYLQLASTKSDTQTIIGIEKIPIHAIIQSITKTLTGWEHDGSATNPDFWTGPDNQTLELSYSDYYFTAEFRGGIHKETLNKIIDIGLDFGCALYDPQINERFAQTEPNEQTTSQNKPAKPGIVYTLALAFVIIMFVIATIRLVVRHLS